MFIPMQDPSSFCYITEEEPGNKAVQQIIT